MTATATATASPTPSTATTTRTGTPTACRTTPTRRTPSAAATPTPTRRSTTGARSTTRSWPRRSRWTRTGRPTASAYAEPAAFGAATVGAATVGGAAVGGAALAADRDAEPVVEDAGTELKPGDVEAEPVVTLMSADVAQGFRDRWRDVQLRFVDDPREAAAEAQTLAEEAVDAMVSALTNHKNELGSWQSAQAGDTEQLRVVVRRYRDLLDRLLGE